MKADEQGQHLAQFGFNDHPSTADDLFMNIDQNINEYQIVKDGTSIHVNVGTILNKRGLDRVKKSVYHKESSKMSIEDKIEAMNKDAEEQIA